MDDNLKTKDELINELKECRRRVGDLEALVDQLAGVDAINPSALEAEAGLDSSSLGGLKGSETILLVDDDNEFRPFVVEALKKGGYMPLGASSAEEAFDLIAKYEGPIHMILTDIMMPGTGGPELAKKVVALKPNIKVLFMSGYAEGLIIPDDVYDVLDSGDSFIEKPFSVRALLQKIRDQFDKKT